VAPQVANNLRHSARSQGPAAGVAVTAVDISM
jgi:hypothetical protein